MMVPRCVTAICPIRNAHYRSQSQHQPSKLSIADTGIMAAGKDGAGSTETHTKNDTRKEKCSSIFHPFFMSGGTVYSASHEHQTPEPANGWVKIYSYRLISQSAQSSGGSDIRIIRPGHGRSVSVSHARTCRTPQS